MSLFYSALNFWGHWNLSSTHFWVCEVHTYVFHGSLTFPVAFTTLQVFLSKGILSPLFFFASVQSCGTSQTIVFCPEWATLRNVFLYCGIFIVRVLFVELFTLHRRCLISFCINKALTHTSLVCISVRVLDHVPEFITELVQPQWNYKVSSLMVNLLTGPGLIIREVDMNTNKWTATDTLLEMRQNNLFRSVF